jgi:hypothetical protein
VTTIPSYQSGRKTVPKTPEISELIKDAVDATRVIENIFLFNLVALVTSLIWHYSIFGGYWLHNFQLRFFLSSDLNPKNFLKHF